MKKEPAQIIYLNGPSSSGKTTLAKALQDVFEEPFLHVGVDEIIGWMPERINNWTGGEAPLGYSWKKGVRSLVMAACLQNRNALSLHKEISLKSMLSGLMKIIVNKPLEQLYSNGLKIRQEKMDMIK